MPNKLGLERVWGYSHAKQIGFRKSKDYKGGDNDQGDDNSSNDDDDDSN